MSETVVIKASDGHELDLYVARPAGEPIAGLVVIQEIFGVNRHIRSIADGYAKDGFLAAAPALLDRVEKGVELSYEGPDAQMGMAFLQKMNLDESLLDIDAALEYVRKETGKKSGVIGFCYGGLLAWLSAVRLRPDAAVGYYAGGLETTRRKRPRSLCSCILVSSTRTFPPNKSKRSTRRTLRCRFTGMRTRGTVSIAICAPAKTRRPRPWLGAEPLRF
jgi:carboxymethylenebutenolidase